MDPQHLCSRSVVLRSCSLLVANSISRYFSWRSLKRHSLSRRILSSRTFRFLPATVKPNPLPGIPSGTVAGLTSRCWGSTAPSLPLVSTSLLKIKQAPIYIISVLGLNSFTFPLILFLLMGFLVVNVEIWNYKQ